MQWRFLIFIALSVGLSLNAVAAEPVPGAQPYQQQRNLVFAEVDGVGLLMDVFTPTGASNGHAIVDVVSGAWHSDRGKLRDHERAQMFRIFCSRGYTVFAIRPGSVGRFTVPEMLDHLRIGIRWVKRHAGEYQIDPDGLGLTGASAGGHLASLVAVTAHETRDVATAAVKGESDTTVKAVGVFFPPTDLLHYGGVDVDVRSQYGFGPLVLRLAFRNGVEGLSEEQISKQVERISPARLVTADTPPFLLIHGNADFLVPLSQSTVFEQALRKAGVPVELIIKQGGGHPWPTIHEEVAVMADWFDRQLLKAPAKEPADADNADAQSAVKTPKG